MALSPEQLSELQAINAKIQDEDDHKKVSVLIAEIMALFEEADRLKHEAA